MRRRFTQSTPLVDRIADRATEIRARAEALAPNSEEINEWKTAEVGAHINEWLTSPGLQAPK